MVNPIYQQDEELLLNPFGSKYLGASEHTDVNSNEFVVQEDAVISVLTGGDASISENDIDYKTLMNLSGVTLKKGALIVAPVGEAFKSITIDSGAIMAYNCVVEGEKPGSFVGLLDDYPDAAAAYSLRKLKADYTGAAIKVRVDTTGQPTYDIGFDSNGDLDTTDLLSKVGANDAYVNTWYDQSGGGNDATQGSASNQPQIVSGGIINKVNNISAVDFDGTDNYLETSNFTEIEQPTSYFGVFKFDSNKNQNIFDSSLNARQLAGDNGTNYKFFGGSTITGGTTNTNQNSFNGIFNSTDSLFINNISVVSGNAGTNGIDKIVIASNYPKTGAFLDGKIQELILYPSDQSANRAGIENNINSYYNMYWDGSQTGILDDYSNSEAAYSLRALNSAYTGPAIRVRRSSDNDVKDIGLLYDGSLDTESLLSFAGSNDAYVSTWYDQSGNGNDATQGSVSAQPKIVSGGTLELLNGKPSVNFINTGDKINLNSTITVSSNFTVFNSNVYSNINYIYGSDSPIASGLISGGTAAGVDGVSVFSNPEFLTYNDSETAAQKLAVLIQNEDTNIDVNNANLVSNSNIGPIYVESIGNRAPTRSFSVRGNIQECIFFSDDKLATKEDIETNINNYYNVY